MKQIKIIFSVLVIQFSLISCEKDCAKEGAEYIIFGHFYGKCVGEGCVEIFRIGDGTLYEDVKDQYPNTENFYSGQFSTLLSNEKYDLVKDLESFFPEALLEEPFKVIGQPDAGDWGGIYFEIKQGASHRFWLLDQNEYNMSDELNEFVDAINEKIALIHQ